MVSKGFRCASAYCEAVAAERAGGERDFLFAGQKENRVHPSIAAASEAAAATLRLPLNAGRRYLKKTPMRQIFFTDAAKEGGEKRKGVSPRGGSRRSRDVKPCIKAHAFSTDICVSASGKIAANLFSAVDKCAGLVSIMYRYDEQLFINDEYMN